MRLSAGGSPGPWLYFREAMARALLVLLLAVPLRAADEPPPSDAYAALLADPAIAGSVIWESTSGPEAYPTWTTARKQDLARALAAVDAGRPAGLEAAPSPILPIEIKNEALDRGKLGIEEKTENCEDDGHVFYSASDAWALYLAHVAHSLWLARGRKLAW